jgi:hypothetical protein
MKTRRAAICALLASICVCQPGDASTVLAKGLFSYEAPLGWNVGPQSNSRFDVAKIGGESDFGSILVSIQESSLPFPEFVEERLRIVQQNEGVHVLRRQAFLTAAGLDGLRVVATGPLLYRVDKTPIQEVLYFFDGGSNQKIIVRATCAKTRAERYTPLFDAALKTFTLE